RKSSEGIPRNRFANLTFAIPPPQNDITNRQVAFRLPEIALFPFETGNDFISKHRRLSFLLSTVTLIFISTSIQHLILTLAL
ncbi:hypothetical protein SB861_64225, partial [Paraburkholderia sp. SIMBA_049]